MQVNVTAVSGPSATVSGVVEYGVAVAVSPVLTVSASIPGTQGPPGGGGDLDLDITPTPAETTDRLLVRRGGSAPFDLDLLSDITPEQLVALAAEIAAARGDRSALTERISTVSNFASPNAGGIVVGQYYDGALHALNNTTLTGAVGRVQMGPFYTSERLRIDQIGVLVSTASGGALGKCFIYGSGSDNWPSDLLFEASDDLDFSTTGFKSHSIDFTFDAGRQYWLGVRTSAGGALRALSQGSSANIGLFLNDSVSYNTSLRRTITYATALPDPWVFDSADFINGSAYSIRMRAAAL